MNEQNLPRTGPFVRSGMTTQGIMLLTILALMPPFGYGVYNFGLRAAIVCGTAVAAAVVFDIMLRLALRKPLQITDFSAVVTGLLTGLCLPVNVPLWLPAAGAFLAIVIVRGLIGGLARFHANPVAAAFVVLWIAFPGFMNTYATDAYTSATPLTLLKITEAETGSVAEGLLAVDPVQMITGRIPGTIGETSMIAIVIGAAVLMLAGIIDWKIPGTLLGTFLLVMLLAGPDRSPLYLTTQLAGGGLMFGAFFVATDPLSTPVTNGAKYLYGALCGLLCALLRIFLFADGTAIAILVSCLTVPLLERVTMPHPFGVRQEVWRKKKTKKEALPEEDAEDGEEEEEAEA